VDLMPATDSPVVARMRAAGAVLLGKANVPVLSHSPTNANRWLYRQAEAGRAHRQATRALWSGLARSALVRRDCLKSVTRAFSCDRFNSLSN
jgi:hypothetical protein